MTYTEILQRILDVEGSRSPERTAAAWSDGQGSVCYGVRVDGQREHQPVCGNTAGCESVRACRSPFNFVLFSSIIDDYGDPAVE